MRAAPGFAILNAAGFFGRRAALLATVLAPGFAWAQMGPPPQGDGIWRRNAYYGEGQTFDSCIGHQPPSGDYHHHANPLCLRAALGDNVIAVRATRNGTIYAEKTSGWTHSPILGWAEDGFPIYGPYGYSTATDATSAIKRLHSSFVLRSITARTSLPSWSLPNHSGISQTLSSSQYGPAVSSAFPLGRYCEDYDYIAGGGELDQYNGRFEVTPEYPAGIYAYHITINDDGSPAFPYIFGGQFAGSVGAYSAGATVPSGATAYGGGASDPTLASWQTVGNTADALVVGGFNPAFGATTLWPVNLPTGASISGGNSAPIKVNVQDIQYTSSAVYISANGLPAYTLGPWFDVTSSDGGVFANFPSAQSRVFSFTRAPAQTTSNSSVGMGPVGAFINGVSAYNFLDGGSYSNSQGMDSGGGTVVATALLSSAVSGERGPAAPGALINASAYFGATLATATATATKPFPTTLGGTTVTLTDSTGAVLAAKIAYASPSLVTFQVPAAAKTGLATLAITAGGTTVSAYLNILSAYPELSANSADNTAVGSAVLTSSGVVSVTSLSDGDVAPWSASQSLELIVQGSGNGKSASATATLGGKAVAVKHVVLSPVALGIYRIKLAIPHSFSGSSTQSLTIKVNGNISNAVNVNFLAAANAARR